MSANEVTVIALPLTNRNTVRAVGEYPTRDEMRNLMLEKGEKLSVVFVGSDASLQTIFGDLRDKLKPVRKVNI